MNVKVKKTNDKARIPTYAHSSDAGMDLFASNECTIAPNSVAGIPIGIRMAIPLGYYGQIIDKSSLAIKGLHVVAGVVDSGYRGEIIIVIRNFNSYAVVVKEGMKLAQMIILPSQTFPIEEVDNIDDTSRGEGGFGSTGAY